MLMSASLPELQPSPASHSSPFPSGLAAHAKARKVAARKSEIMEQRQRNREAERRSNELHFWRQEDSGDETL